MISVAVFEGTLTVRYGSMSATLLSPDDGDGPIKVRVEFHKDDTGQEAVRYLFNGRLRTTLFLTRQGIYGFDHDGTVNLHSLNEAGGPSVWGFVLPPGQSNLFVRPLPQVAPDMRGSFGGEDCAKSDASCVTDGMRVGFSPNSLKVQLRPQNSKISFELGQREMLAWQFGAIQQGFVKRIDYVEHGFSGESRAGATYLLKSVKRHPGTLAQDDFVPKGSTITVMKQGNGYGPYSAKDGDPWAFFQKNDQMWQSLKASSEPAHGIAWLPLSATALVLIVGILILLVRRNK